MSTSQDLTIVRIIKAPVERVWQALTDINQLHEWCPFFTEFKPVVGFRTSFMLGPDEDHQYLHHITILEAIPNEKLAYTWDYGGNFPDSFVEFKLHRENAATRIELTYRIVSQSEIQPDFIKNASKGWNHIADELLQHATKQGIARQSSS